MLRSMTAFGRRESTHDWGTLSWELRSVNHRYLEVSVRLPEELRALEPQVRERLGKRVKRGKTECSLRLKRDTVDVAELHDCFSVNEVLTYEGLGLCEEGGAQRFVDDGDNTYGGQCVVNPSGGLMSKGHPIGATGLAQCFELVRQLRGSAGARQVPDARLGLQHNLGLGGAAVVTLYGRK